MNFLSNEINGNKLCAGDEFYFQWHITEECNQRCAHCYHTSYESSGEFSLSQLDTCFDAMEEALRAWNRKGSFSLTGGEPFLRRPELFHLMSRLDQSDDVAYYDVLTNGTLINHDDLVQLKGATNLRRVQVSLEGSTAEESDVIRGEGPFARTLAAIDSLKNAAMEFSVMFTVTRHNMHSISALIDLLIEHKVDTLAIERFIPEGMGSDMRELILSKAEAKTLFEYIYRLGIAERRIRVLLYRPLFAIIDRDDPTVGAMCSVGINALTVMHDGTIYPCRRLPVPLGNILTDGLFKIWYDSEFLWDVREASRIEECGVCELATLCRGCRAMALHTTGNPLGPDPHCWISECSA